MQLPYGEKAPTLVNNTGINLTCLAGKPGPKESAK